VFAVGNWKMNLTLEEALGLASGVVSQVSELEIGPSGALQVGVAPPFPYLHAVGSLLEGSGVELVAQDCHAEPKGAFTSWVSAPMLRSVGVRRVIVGHSERRKHGGDDDAAVRAKLEAALGAGLGVILCGKPRSSEVSSAPRSRASAPSSGPRS
jgi:triosephosphate isomerase (TIM)